MSRFFWVAVFSYMCTFIAGAMIFGHVAAKKAEDKTSSAKPWATLAIIFAVAGTIIKQSASLTMLMCLIW